jgi:hypothetical protein
MNWLSKHPQPTLRRAIQGETELQKSEPMFEVLD